jgi:hypothetical protein
VILREVLDGGRRVAVGLAGWMAGQDRALSNARRASTEASRQRVERDDVAIYLDAIDERNGAGAASAPSTEEWPRRSAHAAD